MMFLFVFMACSAITEFRQGLEEVEAKDVAFHRSMAKFSLDGTIGLMRLRVGRMSAKDAFEKCNARKTKLISPGPQGASFDLLYLGADDAEGGKGPNADYLASELIEDWATLTW